MRKAIKVKKNGGEEDSNSDELREPQKQYLNSVLAAKLSDALYDESIPHWLWR